MSNLKDCDLNLVIRIRFNNIIIIVVQQSTAKEAPLIASFLPELREYYRLKY